MDWYHETSRNHEHWDSSLGSWRHLGVLFELPGMHGDLNQQFRENHGIPGGMHAGKNEYGYS